MRKGFEALRATVGVSKKIIAVLFIICVQVFTPVSERLLPEAYAQTNAAGETPFTFFMTSDVHYLSESLYDESDTFKDFVNSGDGKMVSYSDEITKAFANDAVTQKPSAVIISGDLTFNGEKASHEDLAKILKEIEDAGISVLVIPGNHDINNPYAREIRQSGFYKADYVTPEQFLEIYGEFGYDEALARDEMSLSYISNPADGIYFLMLDTCMYYSNIENNSSNTGGRIQEETMEWVLESVESIKAKDENAKFITVMHHNLFVHNRNFEFNYVIYSAKKAQKQLIGMGLDIFFSGHIHIQDILTTEIDGRTMTETVSSALAAYPIAYGVAEISGGTMNYQTQWVDMEAYAQNNGSEDENLYDFKQYSEATFTERSAKRIEQTLRESDFSDEDIEAAVSLVKKLNTYYFAGEIDLIADEVKASRGYRVLEDSGMLNDYFESVLEGGRGENNKFTHNFQQTE